jgi:hypothetical protein
MTATYLIISAVKGSACGYRGQVLRMMERHGCLRITGAQSRETPMTIHFLPPELNRYDVAVEDAIATCNGDLRGALKALLILNEHLEAELMELKAAMATGGTMESRSDETMQRCG